MPSMRGLARVLLGTCIVLVAAGSPAFSAADAPPVGGAMPQPKASDIVAVPASRQADRIAVITIRGAIDAITAMSVRRRIQAAELAGMDAMVFEIDSPGGELGAVLEISNMIKSSSIINTLAWVHPDAYSGGAIVALACNEIVTSSPASMGDAFIILIGTGQLRGLTPDQRTKLLPPLMAEVTDSARRSGFDEYLVQAIVVDGVELWLAEDLRTGRRLAINEEEYRLLFGDDVVRGKPMLAEVVGGIKTYREGGGRNRAGGDATDLSDQTDDSDAGENDPQLADGETPPEGGPESTTPAAPDDPEEMNKAYRPASRTLGDIERELSRPELAPQIESSRPALSHADRGNYRLLGYITDGSAAIVMRDDQLQYFGFSEGIIASDADLIAFMGAQELVRVNESWSERLVRFMVNPIVRGVLIVVLLIALFVEMITAGTGIAGAIAIGALALILGPPALVGLSGWWELIAIVVGVLCLAIEAFVIPGFGVFGVVGFVALFGGLIGTFVSAGGSMANPETQKDLMTGAVTVLLAFVTAGIGWWLIVRNMQNLPLFDRLILSGASGVGGMPQKSMLHAIVVDDGAVRVGDLGVTTTHLYPTGQAEIDGEIVDVAAAFGFIERDQAVRVVRVTAMRIEVERVENESGPDSVAAQEGRA